MIVNVVLACVYDDPVAGNWQGRVYSHHHIYARLNSSVLPFTTNKKHVFTSVQP